MVLRLVRRELLRLRGRPQSARSVGRNAPRVSRRFLAPLHKSVALCLPLQHPSRISVHRLRLPRRPFLLGASGKIPPEPLATPNTQPYSCVTPIHLRASAAFPSC